MTRERLDAKHASVSFDLDHPIGGNLVRFTVGYGFDRSGRVKEAFCLAFKSGTDLQSLLHHALIAISVGLQHGASMGELAAVLGEDDAKPPRSIIGAIVRAGAALDREREARP